MTTYLITGASGWLGGRTVDLFSRGPLDRVIATWHRRPPDTDKRANVTSTQLDIGDSQAVTALLADARPDIVIHTAAAITTASDPVAIGELTRTNIQGTANLFLASQRSRARRFIYCSSVSVYGQESPPEGFAETGEAIPSTAYGMTKLAGEFLLQAGVGAVNSLSAVSLRLAGIHGSGRSAGVIDRFVRQAMRNECLHVSDPSLYFNYLFIDDAVHALDLVSRLPLPERYACYNVAGRDVLSLAELAALVVSRMRSASEVRFGGLVTDRRYRALNIDRLASEMHYQPKSLSDNLDALIAAISSVGAGK